MDLSEQIKDRYVIEREQTRTRVNNKHYCEENVNDLRYSQGIDAYRFILVPRDTYYYKLAPLSSAHSDEAIE